VGIAQRHWLMKNELTNYSIANLAHDTRTCWEGVRNYQARNFMRDAMTVGDLAIFYSSNADPSGAAGVMRIAKAAYPDDTQFDRRSKYFDPKATQVSPRWWMVDVEFVETFPTFVSLATMRDIKACHDMLILQKGSRLSITPITEEHFEAITTLGNRSSSK
jgi:predicted RNA-binding protein with PUA-like domain